MRTSTIGRSPEIPCRHSSDGPRLLPVSTADERSQRQGPSTRSGWRDPERDRPHQRRCRDGAAGPGPASTPASRRAQMLLDYCTRRPGRAPRRAIVAISVENVTRAEAPGASLTQRLRLIIGSSTAPTVLESGWPSMTDIGVRMPRPRPRNRARSVSYSISPTVSPSATTTCAAQTCGSPCDRGRRVASRAPSSAEIFRLHEQIGKSRVSRIGSRRRQDDLGVRCQLDVSAFVRPRFVIDTRRTSASCSGETTISRVVPIAPSRRRISTRSSEKATS